MLLYAVTDRRWTKNTTLEKHVEDAIKGGVTCVQLREKNMDHDDFLAEAINIGKICRKYNIPFIIDDNIEIAVESDSDGVHIGQGDMPLCEARRILGDDKIIGVTARTKEQAVEAERDGADYIGSGAVFKTDTKTDTKPLSYDELKEICGAVAIPVVAIGGINKDNILTLRGSGAAGAALVSAIFGAEDIENECKKLRALSERMVKG